MEEHGIHDSVVSPGDLEGFVSGEIALSNQMTVMQLWWDWFSARGFTLGKIKKVRLGKDGSDLPRSEDRMILDLGFDDLVASIRSNNR
jgi:hypothetical protein